MMKILIWDKEFPLSNIGGPSGYLFNIHEYLKTTPSAEITFYSDVVKKSVSENANKKKSTIRSILGRFKLLQLLLKIKNIYFKSIQLSKGELDLINSYDVVHIHTFYDAMVVFTKTNNIKAKIVLTTHCPEPCIDEIAGLFGYRSFISNCPILRNYLISKECKAIKKVDFYMLPVQEAVEPYVVGSRLYKDLFDGIKRKMFFIPTSLFPTEKIDTSSRKDLDKRIPQNALRICYIGRHNEIKGYAKLKEIAQQSWEKNNNLYFIIGGKEGPLYGLEDDKWLELGWVNTIELLNSIDVFVLPNKQTYFDLILLEVLRQGKICLMTRTGGNKWFEQYKETGLFFYDYNDIEEASNILNTIYELKKRDGLKELENRNLMFFKMHFSTEAFITRYLSELNRLTNS